MNDVVKFIDKILPVSNGLNYNTDQNVFLTPGNESRAGNVYLKGLRLSDRIYIVFDIGVGYAYTFLNGMTIFANVNNEKKVIGKREYHCQTYDESTIKAEAKEIVLEKLRVDAIAEGAHIDEEWMVDFVDKLVEDTYLNQIETLKNIQLNNILIK